MHEEEGEEGMQRGVLERYERGQSLFLCPLKGELSPSSFFTTEMCTASEATRREWWIRCWKLHHFKDGAVLFLLHLSPNFLCKSFSFTHFRCIFFAADDFFLLLCALPICRVVSGVCIFGLLFFRRPPSSCFCCCLLIRGNKRRSNAALHKAFY